MSVDHYENFPVASWLLPTPLRESVAAIYGFARSADDIADEGEIAPADRLRELDGYRQELAKLATSIPPDSPIFVRLGKAVATHDLPLQHFSDLLDAFSQDVEKVRYIDFAELLDYCRRSANPVGRLLLRLYRAERQEQLAWSDSICTGLQLVNHWQDVSIDYSKGRIYLPLQDMAQFGVSEDQVAGGTVDGNWRALLAFQVARARAMLIAGSPLGRSLPGRIGLELRMMVAGGLRILEKIEAADYDVFRRRPRLKLYDWPMLFWTAAAAYPEAGTHDAG